MNLYRRIAHYFPIFHVSDDSQFGDIGKSTEKKDLRYSLLAIWLGQYLIHILSAKDGHLSLIKVLNLDTILDNTLKTNDESIERYTEALNNFEDDTIHVHVDGLKFKIEEERRRYDTTLSKTAVYNAALLVALSVAFHYLLKLYELKSTLIIVLFPFGLVFFVSALILSFRMLRITSINSFGFNDVAKSDNSLRALAAGLYYRYKHANVEADKIVSYNTNLQKNTRQFLAWALITLVALNAHGFIEESKRIEHSFEPCYISIEDSKITGLQTLNRLETSLLAGQATRIIITGGQEDQVEKVHNILEFYNVKGVPIDIVKSTDDTEMSIVVMEDKE